MNLIQGKIFLPISFYFQVASEFIINTGTYQGHITAHMGKLDCPGGQASKIIYVMYVRVGRGPKISLCHVALIYYDQALKCRRIPLDKIG